MDEKKVIFILKGIYKNSVDKNELHDIVAFSTFKFEEYFDDSYFGYNHAYEVTIYTEHEIFIKHYHLLETLKKELKKDLSSLLPLSVGRITIKPDYDKLENINSEIRPVYTVWDEINTAQDELITQLQKSSTSFEIKNIGNTSRVILKNLAKLVFKNEKHTQSTDVSGDNNINQLNSYISIELAGKRNEELRAFAKAAINLVDKANTLANSITHRTKTDKQIAEVCVTGIISVISIISFIEKTNS
jgi:hypothetical protein